MPTLHLERTLPYSPDQLFDVVADIKSYPEFVPWCDGLSILEASGTGMLADVAVGYKGIHKQFRCRAHLSRSTHIIQVELIDGPFTRFSQRWQFLPVEAGQGKVVFDIDFGLRSTLLEMMAKAVCQTMCNTFIEAFEKQAKKRYGKSY